MFTPDSLLDLAIQQQAIVDANPQAPGTINDINYEARKLRDKAFRTALHMERHGIGAAHHVLEFSTHLPQKGDLVRLRKGALIRSTNPQEPRDGRPNGVNRNIKVFDTYKGYTDICGGYPESNRNAQINWVGTGGYWYWTDANNVEVIQ